MPTLKQRTYVTEKIEQSNVRMKMTNMGFKQISNKWHQEVLRKVWIFLISSSLAYVLDLVRKANTKLTFTLDEHPGTHTLASRSKYSDPKIREAFTFSTDLHGLGQSFTPFPGCERLAK